MAVLMVLAAGSVLPCDGGPDVDRRPMIVFVTYGAWSTVPLSESPRFVLYDDGLVIYKVGHTDNVTSPSMSFMCVQLTGAEAKGLYASIVDSLRLDGDVLFAVQAATNLPVHELHLWSPGTYRKITVIGSLDKYPPGLAETVGIRGELPSSIVKAFAAVRGYGNERGRPWHPEQVDVLIWPANLDCEVEPWPPDWPTTASSSARPRRRDPFGRERWSIRMDYSNIDRVRALMSKRNDSGRCLEMEGKKWELSFRLPFPAEDHWRWMDP